VRRLDFLNKIYTANVLTCTSFDGVTAAVGPAKVFWPGFLFMAIGFVSYVFGSLVGDGGSGILRVGGDLWNFPPARKI